MANLYWSITGWDAPELYSETDGYKVTAALNWPVARGAGTPSGDALEGACVEGLDANNRAAARIEDGAAALCHWARTTGQDQAYIYGRALKTLSVTEWNTGWESATKFTTTSTALKSGPGTAVDASLYGVAYYPADEPTGTTHSRLVPVTISATYYQYYEWWQPEESADYEAGLRRYAKNDKVQGWHVQRTADTVTL